MPRSRLPRSASSLFRGSVLCALCLLAGAARAERDPDFESAADVNEGVLHFLATPPAKAVHHHHNRIRIDPDSLRTGWVSLAQCHDHLDPVAAAQITFRDGFVRDLKVDSFSGIEQAWVEGASVQLKNVAPGARLCLSAHTRALRDTGGGYYILFSGPYLRKFLDGYYPMRVTLEIRYPVRSLSLVDVSPPAQPGLSLVVQPGTIRIDALFEGELQTHIQFEKP